ncbi:MAG: macrolide ABC transporter ATP-binding protein, partial [Acidobacteriota bacterium]
VAQRARRRKPQQIPRLHVHARIGPLPAPRHRHLVARAFMLAPPILMADEPTGNLDSANGQHVLDLLLTMNRQQRTTLVLVTHDPQLAARADRRLLMRDGVIVSDE